MALETCTPLALLQSRARGQGQRVLKFDAGGFHDTFLAIVLATLQRDLGIPPDAGNDPAACQRLDDHYDEPKIVPFLTC